MSKSKHSSFDRFASIGSLCIALIAIAISIVSCWQTEKHNNATIRPYVVLDTLGFSNDETKAPELAIVNHGLGPAIIRSVAIANFVALVNSAAEVNQDLKVQYNPTTIEYWDALAKSIGVGINEKCAIEYGVHRGSYVISPASRTVILSINNKCSYEDKKKFVGFILKNKFIVNYESISGEQFTIN